MRTAFKKLGIAALAGITVVGASLASADPAEARWRGHRHHHHGGGWGWGGPALVGGLALGTALGAGSAYAYGGGCPLVRQVVGYRPSGRPIVRWVRSCY